MRRRCVATLAGMALQTLALFSGVNPGTSCSGRRARSDRRVPPLPVATFNGTTARYVGAELDLLANYTFTRHLLGYAGYSHFFPGEFIEKTGPSKPSDFVYFALQYMFWPMGVLDPRPRAGRGELAGSRLAIPPANAAGRAPVVTSH